MGRRSAPPIEGTQIEGFNPFRVTDPEMTANTLRYDQFIEDAWDKVLAKQITVADYHEAVIQARAILKIGNPAMRQGKGERMSLTDRRNERRKPRKDEI